MTTPQDPDESSGDEPAGDELPGQPAENPSADEQADEERTRAAAEEALWRSIIENYGDRPQLDDEPTVEVPPSPRALDVPTRDEPAELATSDREEHYVPPVPPPLPKPPPARLLAWTGLFGVPTIVLIALVAHLVLPPWLGLVLMFWFVGGFVFLVASMRPGQSDDYDDGARL